MTVWFGNTLDAFMVDTLTGRAMAGLVFNPYIDIARTTRASGLVDEDGTPSDSTQPVGYGHIIGKTVTSKVYGALAFGAPDGTTVLYYDRGDGKSAAIYPTGANSALPSNVLRYTTDEYGGITLLDANGAPLS